VADDVVMEGRPVTRVVVKVRYRPFTTRTHGVPMVAGPSDATTIEAAALQALELFTERRPVRLLGVRADLAEPPGQT
jgi:DNA polymerase-4